MNEKSKVAGHNRLWVSIVFALIAVGLFFNLNSFHGSKNNSQIYAQIDSIYKVEVKPVEQTDYIQSVINHIERNLIFPQDTAKKEDYIGYYSIRETAEKKELVAVFLLKGGWWNYYSKLHMMENIVKPHSNVFFVHLENLRKNRCHVTYFAKTTRSRRKDYWLL